MRVCAAGMLAGLLAAGAVASEGPPTFHRDVAPVLRAKCGGCHRPDGLAPFSLVTWAGARENAGKVARIALDGLMPPWLPANGGFAHARKLTPHEVALLRRWTEGGALEGNAPSEKHDQHGKWQLGEPDLVLTVPKPYIVAADGRLQTVHFVFAKPLGEERYLRAVEVIPGNRRVVLQARVLFDRSGRARELAGEIGWYERFGGSGFFPSGMMWGYEPGIPPDALPADSAMTLAADTDLIVQVRYRPAGTEQVDVPQVALYFADKAPQRSPSAVYLGNESLRVAPGADEVIVRDKVVLAAPMEVRDLRPNLLLHGRAMHSWAERPDGKRVPLLEIPEWEFTWQQTYRLAQPIALPKGTRIFAEWTIENPGDREVRVGDTPLDEAPSLWVGGLVQSWGDHLALTGANLTHLTNLTNEARKNR